MRETRMLYLALGMLIVTSIGAVSLHDDGIEYPDGSFQTTVAFMTAASAVQGEVNLYTPVAGAYCTTPGTLYDVPAGKRLVIEWLAAETTIPGGAPTTHPVDVDIITHDGGGEIYHPLTRIYNPEFIGPSSNIGNRVAGPVALYSEGNQALKARMCLETNLVDQLVGSVSFSGYLIDV